MSYNLSQDPNSEHGNPSYGIPPQGPYGQPPQEPYGVPPQGPYGQLQQGPYGPPPQGSYGDPQKPYGYGVPPQGPYGSPYQQSGDGYSVPPVQPSPLPLGEAIRQLPSQYIRVLTKPSAATFAEEMGKAAWNIVWVQLIVLAVLTAVFEFLASLIGMNSAMLQGINFNSFGELIGVPLGFFISQGILYLIAKAFGGEGTFLDQGYIFLLYDVPLGILTSVLSVIPILGGGLVVFAATIYGIVLQIFSIMAVHRLSGGKATLVVFIPVIVVLVLACIVVYIAIAVLHSQPQP